MNKLEELLDELYDLNSKDINIDTKEFYKIKYDFILFKINNLKKEEPFKLFKKAHKKWEDKINILNNELNEIKNIF